MSNTAKRVLFVVFLVAIALLAYEFMTDAEEARELNYNEFIRALNDDQIDSVTIIGRDNVQEIRGEYRVPVEGAEGEEFNQFVTTAPKGSETSILNMLEEQGVTISAREHEEGIWSSFLIWWLPFLVIIGVWVYFIWRTRSSMGGGMMGVGESKAELYDEEKPSVTFDNVAGYEGPKNEVTQIVQFLKSPEKFDRVGGEIPKGILMTGPPGTGKTLMARAIAGEAEVPFLSTSGSDFMEMFVGVGASRVRDLFKRAKEVAPAIIFIDEIDSVGRKRGTGVGGGHDEREQTLNQLLNEMDGFEPNSGIILLAATNRPDILDQALMRPGRFDRQVTFGMPAFSERHKILEIHAEDKPLSEDVDLEKLARGTPGFSGADLENLLNEAALLSAEEDREIITRDVVEEARDKVLMGLRRDEMTISEDERETMAVHEAGHTLVAHFTHTADPVHKVTIIPRGRALGATQQLPLEEKKMYTREDLMGRLAVMMGGRAAEELKINSITNGAQDDLRRATKLARKMVLEWGMSPEIGNIAYQDNGNNVFLGEEMAQNREYSEETAEKIDDAIREIIDSAMFNAQQILEDHEDDLNRVVSLLKDRETLSAEEIKTIIETGELPEDDEQPDAEEVSSGETDGEASDPSTEESEPTAESRPGPGEERSDGDSKPSSPTTDGEAGRESAESDPEAESETADEAEAEESLPTRSQPDSPGTEPQ